MNRRGAHSDPASFVNLDSFMDIVTNVIGALFFVIVYATLNANIAGNRIGTVPPTTLDRQMMGTAEIPLAATAAVAAQGESAVSTTETQAGALPATTTVAAALPLPPPVKTPEAAPKATTVSLAAGAKSPAPKRVARPLLSMAETESVIFECRRNTVLFPGTEELIKYSNDLWKYHKEQGISDFDTLVGKLNGANIHNLYYTYRADVGLQIIGNQIGQSVTDVLTPTSAVGEDAAKLRQSDSLFRQGLSRLDPTRQHIFFLIRSDSFEVFQAAREIIYECGFSAGWEPVEAGDPLRFGGGGGVVSTSAHF